MFISDEPQSRQQKGKPSGFISILSPVKFPPSVCVVGTEGEIDHTSVL